MSLLVMQILFHSTWNLLNEVLLTVEYSSWNQFYTPDFVCCKQYLDFCLLDQDKIKINHIADKQNKRKLLRLFIFLNHAFQTTSVSGELSSSTLAYVPQSTDNGKTLQCRATNPDMERGILEDAWELNVQCKWTVSSYQKKCFLKRPLLYFGLQ